MTRHITRLSLILCSFGAVISGCGQDEFVQPPLAPDAGDTQGPGPTSNVPSPTSTTTTGPTTPAPVSPSPGGNSMLGASCARNNDCGADLFCLLPSSDEWLGGGAPNGFCTADCSMGGDPQCAAIAGDSFCIGVSDTEGYCVLTCEPGGSLSKCQDRPDVACDVITLATSGISFCRPLCRGDEDCDGRKCDLGNGACYDDLPEGDGIGAGCDPEAATSTCTSGICLSGATEGTAEAGYCSGLCTVGAGGCGSADGTVEAGGGFCLPAWEGTDFGDLGLCLQSCNCDSDCDSDLFRCGRYPGALEGLGVEGFCFEFDAEFSAESGIELGIECAAVDSGSDAMTPIDGAADAMVPWTHAAPWTDADVPTTGPGVSPADAAADAD